MNAFGSVPFKFNFAGYQFPFDKPHLWGPLGVTASSEEHLNFILLEDLIAFFYFHAQKYDPNFKLHCNTELLQMTLNTYWPFIRSCPIMIDHPMYSELFTIADFQVRFWHQMIDHFMTCDFFKSRNYERIDNHSMHVMRGIGRIIRICYDRMPYYDPKINLISERPLQIDIDEIMSQLRTRIRPDILTRF